MLQLFLQLLIIYRGIEKEAIKVGHGGGEGMVLIMYADS